jgi:protein ImuB
MNAGLWLCIRIADAAVEHAIMERLAAWAYQWSSLVSYRLADGPLLWLELAASRTLFGGHAALLANIEAGLTQLGYSHACALAPSPTGAALLTQVGQQRCVTTHSQLRSRLDALPLSLLALPPEVLAALQSAGLRRIGQLLRLPAASIARRFGPAASLYLQRLCGAASDPRPAWRVPATYRARFEFPGEVHAIRPRCCFRCDGCCWNSRATCARRDCAVQRFTLEFEHYRHAASGLTIGMSAPARDAAQFLAAGARAPAEHWCCRHR